MYTALPLLPALAAAGWLSVLGAQLCPAQLGVVLGEDMCVLIFRGSPLWMVNRVRCGLWCTTTPDMTWQSNTEEPVLPID